MAAVFAGLMLWAANGLAQEPVIRTQTTVVLAPALVKDSKGKLVYGLHAADFIIEDDGVEQTVQLDEVVDTQPVSLVIAIQTGGSAAGEFARMRGLGNMLDPVIAQGQTEVAIVEFASKVHLLRDFTKDGARLRSDLANIRPGDGGAAILDAINYSVKLLNKKPNNRQRVLLLISETRDHGSALKIADVATTLANSNTVTYTLAFSPSLSSVLDPFRGPARSEAAPMNVIPAIAMAFQAMRKNIPKTIGLFTGGEYELFKSDKGFDNWMNEFDNHLYSRYLLSFQPEDPHPGFHAVEVRLRNRPGTTVLARTSYWVEPKLAGSTKPPR
jgi:VWFA-related protein